MTDIATKGGRMKITSPEQLIKHALAGGSVIIKTPSWAASVDNETLMDLTMQDAIALVRKQDIYTDWITAYAVRPVSHESDLSHPCGQ